MTPLGVLGLLVSVVAGLIVGGGTSVPPATIVYVLTFAAASVCYYAGGAFERFGVNPLLDIVHLVKRDEFAGLSTLACIGSAVVAIFLPQHWVAIVLLSLLALVALRIRSFITL